jgi:tRNA(Met) C34 N-acetyltransferase TmcA
MEPNSQAKRPAEVADVKLQRMESALAKCTELMERHLAAGEKTVPARALYFILRDAGYRTSPTQKQMLNQAPQQQQPTNQLHHNYGMRR